MGGRIWVESQVGVGSIFHFTIQVRLADARHAGGQERQAAQIDRDLARKLPLRILVADDSVVNQKVARMFLERMGYRCDLAANGLEVLEALKRQHYDVVLMDVQMPELDGLETTRRIRKNTPRGQAAEDRRGDRRRHARRPREMPGRRHGRLRLEAGAGRGAAGRPPARLEPHPGRAGQRRRRGRGAGRSRRALRNEPPARPASTSRCSPTSTACGRR